MSLSYLFMKKLQNGSQTPLTHLQDMAFSMFDNQDLGEDQKRKARIIVVAISNDLNLPRSSKGKK